MNKFSIPSEPRPLSSLDSDEESFVVLGKSLSPETGEDVSIGFSEPLDKSVIEEARRLISRELNAIEKSTGESGSSIEAKSIGTEPVPQLQICPAKIEGDAKSLEEKGTTDLPELPFVNKGFDTTNTISITTFSSDLTSEETQNKIAQIIEENIRLKDTILQNNMSMKSQYERIIVWQEEVQKVHQTHKDKILEAKDIIEKLKKENFAMNQEMENLRQTIKSQSGEIRELQSVLTRLEFEQNVQIKEASHANMKEFQLEAAKEKIRNLEEALKTMVSSQQSEAKVPDNNDLTVKITELQEELANVNEENRYLRESLKEKSNENSLVKSTGSEGKKSEELAALVEMVQNMTLEKFNLNTEKQNLKTSVEIHAKHIEELEKQTEDLKKKLEDQQQVEIQLRNEIQKMLRMRAPIQETQKQLDLQEELANARTALASTQINLTEAQQSKAALNAQVEQLKREVERLNKQIEETQKTAEKQSIDEIFALKTQLELYKNDYEAECAAKSSIKEEKDKLLEDMQNLQRRNQQLQEEIDLIRENRDFHVFSPSPRREPPARTTPMTDSPPLRRYACPVCKLQFRSLRLLEEHVDMCIRHRS